MTGRGGTRTRDILVMSQASYLLLYPAIFLKKNRRSDEWAYWAATAPRLVLPGREPLLRGNVLQFRITVRSLASANACRFFPNTVSTAVY
jgi:hypothetical protein